MKKVLLTLLTLIVVVGAVVGAGYAGYRFGFRDGLAGSDNAPAVGRTFHMEPGGMPMYRFGDDLHRDFGFHARPFRAPMMGRGYFGINIFSPFRLLWNAAILALVIWFFYWLFTKSGWQITRKMDKEVNVDPGDPTGN